MSEIVPSVHPDLARHQESMQPRIYTLKGSIHCAFAYSIVNCTLIEGEDSCILVDTMTGMDNAETVAADYLLEKGYRVLHRRYRAAGGEIDLIAADGDCCVFVEVKSTDRASDRPEDRVRRDKRAKLIRCARQFVERSAAPGTEYRFDVVAVDLSARTPAVEHMEDAFDAGA